MAIDQQGNLYYGTSYPLDPNALYRWDYSVLQLVIEDPARPVLQVTHAEKLSNLPSGAYDCEVDEGGNVLFNMNLSGGTQALVMWNGTIGDGNNIDTLATASGEWDWLGTLKAKGDVSLAGPDNMLVTYSFGQPLAIVSRLFTVEVERDFAPKVYTYPNPSTGIITIQSGSSELMDIKLYTLQGSLVYEKSNFVSGEVIDISNQATGSYIIRVSSTNGSTSKMIQKL
jgi:hypothetical protein